ncbi:MAG: gamma-glutamyl-gamma-aminobutyrate hydrolase family protein, partial [Alphaproteobacteria bacterium]
MTDTILIIDFGSQVTQLIARRVRESGVYSEVVPFHVAEAALQRLAPKGIILSGGPASVIDTGTPRAPDAVFSAGVPVLGICYGQQTMVAQLGGEVSTSTEREFGRADIEITGTCPLFEGLAQPNESLRV